VRAWWRLVENLGWSAARALTLRKIPALFAGLDISAPLVGTVIEVSTKRQIRPVRLARTRTVISSTPLY
jgi:hypothetical protein